MQRNMTVEIADIEKLRKIGVADGFIGCLMEHILRENEYSRPGIISLSYSILAFA